MYCGHFVIQVDIEIDDLFVDLRDGSILLLLLELFTGTKLVNKCSFSNYPLIIEL